MLNQVHNDTTDELERREMSPDELDDWAARLEERAEALLEKAREFLRRAEDLYDGLSINRLEIALKSGNHADIADAVERLERALGEYESDI